ncbi:unnamed protein product [Alopecurus aequalis]
MYHDDFSMSLVPVGDSQIPSYVDDSQPLSNTLMTDSSPSLVVHQFLNNDVAAVNRRIPKVKGTMKCLAHMSNFVLRHMSTLVKSGIRTDKGFKEVHLTACVKALFEHYGVEVTSTQVYNHLRKWRLRWIQAHPKDVEFMNRTIENFVHMQVIFSFGLATGKFAIGSGDPLGVPLPEDAETRDSEPVIVDGPAEKQGEGHAHGHNHGHGQGHGLKRKRGALGDDEIQAFASMTEVVKEVASAIRDNKQLDKHPDLYSAVMDQIGFTDENLMVALGHLVDHRAQGVNFVGMSGQHRTLWLRTFLARYHMD